MEEDGRETEDQGGVERQLKMEGEAEGEGGSFNIKQHGEKCNVPFMAPFACL